MTFEQARGSLADRNYWSSCLAKPPSHIATDPLWRDGRPHLDAARDCA